MWRHDLRGEGGPVALPALRGHHELPHPQHEQRAAARRQARGHAAAAEDVIDLEDDGVEGGDQLADLARGQGGGEGGVRGGGGDQAWGRGHWGHCSRWPPAAGGDVSTFVSAAE